MAKVKNLEQAIDEHQLINIAERLGYGKTLKILEREMGRFYQDWAEANYNNHNNEEEENTATNS